jgi:hypothetical protein
MADDPDVPYLPGNPFGASGPAPGALGVSIPENQMVDAIKTFIQGIVGTGVPVVRGQDNRVAQPAQGDYFIVTPSARHRIATNQDTYDTDADRRHAQRSIRADVQIDAYGPNSADYTEAVSMLFRDMYGTEVFAPFSVQPLYCGDGQQMPLVNGEEQYEDRWTFSMSLQLNPAVSTSQQFADSVVLNLVEAD